MRCPRCGLQNAPGAAQCMRCAHRFVPEPQQRGLPPRWQQPAGGSPDQPAGTQPRPGQPPGDQQSGWQHPGYAPKPPPPPPPPPEPEYGSVWRVLATIMLCLTALASAGYGVWAITARRSVFADLAEGDTVTFEAAQASDRLNALLLWTAVVLLVVAVVLWLLAHLLRRKPLGIAGFTAIALFVLGLLVTVGGAFVTSLVDGEVAEAGTGALGFLIMGIGFLFVAAGAVAAVVAAYVKPPRPETPNAGFAGWQSP